MKMFPDSATQAKAAENLAALVKKNDYRIGTGFPGTPYILFALADNGQEETAFRMLTNTDCPSWLYEVKAGATTIWERWDGLDENGVCPIGDDGTDTMISYNHYASGAVGAFLYRRVAGIEATEAGYRTFRIQPLEDGVFNLTVQVPVDTTCQLTLPDGTTQTLGSGQYSFTC
jgi:alpha-L-rhamnosidase